MLLKAEIIAVAYESRYEMSIFDGGGMKPRK